MSWSETSSRLDFSSPDFVKEVRKLADHLKVANHPDHLVTLEAIATLINTKMATKVLQNSPEGDAKSPPSKPLEKKREPWPFMEIDLGLESKDPVVTKASRVLRLLYIHDLRDLQTKINECLVAVQTVSANPKTDAKLGQVGS